MNMLSRMYALLVASTLLVVGCDKVPLLAPTNSTVTLTAATTVLPTGGSTDVTAFVAESSGTPVQNGTRVRFTTNLGRMEPVEVETLNGYAGAVFLAGDVSGLADVRAMSGSAGGTTGEAAGSTASNLVQIAVGAAAVESVLLAANPSFIPSRGGTVDLLATVVGAGGRSLKGVGVTFRSTEGQLASTTAVSDASGQARTSLTTERAATVAASAGTKTSNEILIARRDPPANVTATLTAVADLAVLGVGQRWSFTANVTGTNPDTQAKSYEWSFGDGTIVTTNGNAIAHVYTSGPNSAKIVSVTISLTNGESIVATTEILLGTF